MFNSSNFWNLGTKSLLNIDTTPLENDFDDLMKKILKVVPGVDATTQINLRAALLRSLKKAEMHNIRRASAQMDELNHALTDIYNLPTKTVPAKSEKIVLSAVQEACREPALFEDLIMSGPFFEVALIRHMRPCMRVIMSAFHHYPAVWQKFLNSKRDLHDMDNVTGRDYFGVSRLFGEEVLHAFGSDYLKQHPVYVADMLGVVITDNEPGINSKYASIVDSFLAETKTNPSSKNECLFFGNLFGYLASYPIPEKKALAVLPFLEKALSSSKYSHNPMVIKMLRLNAKNSRKKGAPSLWDTFMQMKLTTEQASTLLFSTLSGDKMHRRALNMKLNTPGNTSKYVLWDILDKGIKGYDNPRVAQLMRRAVHEQNREFIFSPKQKMPPKDSKCYQVLRSYFADQPMQALAFLNTVEELRGNIADKLDDLKDFVPSKVVIRLFRDHRVLHQWAKRGDYQRIQNFFKEHNVTPEQRISFWMQADDQGMTPWHYVCDGLHQEFFKKMTPSMRDSFLSLLPVRNKDGYALLDYIYRHTKTMKLLTETIPGVHQALIDAGYNITAIPEVKKVVPAPIIPEPVQTLREQQAAAWDIQYRGNDSEWSNPEFKQLIEEEISRFPAPCSAAMRAKQQAERKIIYNTSAFKTTYSGKPWRVPYIAYGNRIYIFPSRERDHAYDRSQLDYIGALSRQLRRELEAAKKITSHKQVAMPTLVGNRCRTIE